jgi:hypothetical protein
MSIFKIIICELFHPSLFGIDENSDKNINGHFIVLNTYGHLDKDLESDSDSDEEDYEEYNDEEYNDEENNIFEKVEKDIIELKKQRRRIQITKHPLVRNYKKIVYKCMRFEIAQCITLSGDEYVAILKTFWIKIIIRAFKNAFKIKMWKIYLNNLKGIKGYPMHTSILRGLLVKK